MWTQRSYRREALFLVVTAALASCLLALALAAAPARAADEPLDLSVSQADGPDPLRSGHLTYTLTVRHETVDWCGGACYNSRAISLEDTLPSGVVLDEINVPTTTPAGRDVSVACTVTGTVACTVDNLRDGDSVDIEFLARVTSAGARTLTNTATVVSAAGEPDPDPGNNTSTATTQVAESYTPFAPLPDTEPPQTDLVDQYRMPAPFSKDDNPSFSFASTDALGATFECKTDDNPFEPCTSPEQLSSLSEGPHTFQVRAKDASGNVDQTPEQHTWTVDTLEPSITFTERPGNATGPDEYDPWITNDATPSWAWTIEDANPLPERDACLLYEETYEAPYDGFRFVFSDETACPSPFNVETGLSDGTYHLRVCATDKASNVNCMRHIAEVDTVAPRVVSATPTGRTVSRHARVKVAFSEEMRPATVRAGTFRLVNTRTGKRVAASVGCPAPCTEAELDPAAPLAANTRYKAMVTTGMKDTAGNALDQRADVAGDQPKAWSFKTEG